MAPKGGFVPAGQKLNLAILPPEAVVHPAVVDFQETGGVAFRHLDGMDQVLFVQFGVVLHPKLPGFNADFSDFHVLLTPCFVDKKALRFESLFTV
jgi:hypothetical protein